MSSRTISTTPEMEDSIKFLSAERGMSGEDYLMDKLTDFFSGIIKESNEKKFEKVSEILDSKDPSKIIPALKELLS